MGKDELVFIILNKRGYVKSSPSYVSSIFGVTEDLAREAIKEARLMLKSGVAITRLWGKDGSMNKSISRELSPKKKEAIRLAKDNLRLRDIATYERKSWREVVRIENILTQLTRDLLTELKAKGLEIKKYNYYGSPVEGDIVIAQVSDLHLNELVDLPNNHYDFIEASKRLQKYATEIKRQYKARGARKIVVAMTGDLLNSDRRLDEILAASTNRAKASVIAVQLLTYFINDLNSIAPIDVVCISGNESRIREEWGLGEFLASDNYDIIIYNFLKAAFSSHKSVNFIENRDSTETVIKLNNVNILLTHGTTIKATKDTQQYIQQIVGKYANKGILLNYILFGHVHFANLTDLYSRSGSLVGNNVYSDRGLNLVTRPSQIIHFIGEDTSISNMRVDLQFTKDYDGYPIKDDLDAYHAKSTDNLLTLENSINIIE